jgi:hypothetical protein
MLIKLSFLKDLLDKYWFDRALLGLAFGAAAGLFREHDIVVRMLQRVVATVLAVLAPVLALGLLVFVLALPFTGLHALWDATSATTPILLSCVVGALILANAVIGDKPEHERTFPLLKFGAMGLALVVFPLSVIAATAIGLRIGQYGFTPERLWALTFVVIATAYSIAYLYSLRWRMGWAEKVRPANLNLAFAVCGVALLLATPLVSFNAISTRDQVARLESGKTRPEQFDWRALAFQFGQPGKDALKRLTGSSNAKIREQAVAASKTKNMWEVSNGEDEKRLADLAHTLRILPQGTALPDDLRQQVADNFPCGRSSTPCTLTFLPGGTEAVLTEDACFTAQAQTPTPAKGENVTVVKAVPNGWCGVRDPERYVLSGGTWAKADSNRSINDTDRAGTDASYKAGKIEVRKVERRQVFVGDRPVGDAFE